MVITRCFFLFHGNIMVIPVPGGLVGHLLPLATIYKFIQKSASEKECQNDAQMLENGCPKCSRNPQNTVKVEVQKTIEKT